MIATFFDELKKYLGRYDIFCGISKKDTQC